MPRLMGAILCGTLIWVYPRILTIVFDHAETTERFLIAYLALAGATVILSGLIGFYLWLGFKAGPSGLEHALRQLGKVFGKDEEQKDLEKTEDPAK